MLNKAIFFASHFMSSPEGQKAIGFVAQNHPHVANMLHKHLEHHNHFMSTIMRSMNKGNSGSMGGSGGGKSSGF